MRTRLVPTLDNRNPEFLRLPLPHLPPPDFSATLDHFHCFDDAPLFTFDLQIEKFSIQNALNKFLSDAIPNDIEFNINHFANDQLLDDQIDENYNGVNSEEKLLDMCSGVIQGDNVYSLDATRGSKTKFLDFEVIEPDISMVPLGNDHDFQKEILHIFATDAKIYKGVPNPELRLQNYFAVERAVYTIDDIASDYSIKQPEDNENSLGIYQSRNSGFPLFEVDEPYPEVFSGNTSDQLLIFESIEAQICLLEVEQIVNDNDTMGLAKVDLLENLSDHLDLCAIVEIPPLNFFQEMELMVAIEHLNTEDHSQGITNEDLTSAKRSYTFEELKFLESRAAYYFEIFSGAALKSEMETCETMFSEAMHFKNFSELVVSHELTLMDDSFKALPVPILPDHEQMKPLMFFIEETLKLLEPQHLSMSNDLYLDWHFLVEDHGSSNEYLCGGKLLQDISYCDTVYDFDTTDLGMLIDKFIFSDDVTDISYSKEDKENLKIASVSPSVPLVSLGCTADAALRILMKDESTERHGGLHCKSALSGSTDKIQELLSFIPYQESSGGRPSEFVDKGKTCSSMPSNCVSSTLRKQICTSDPSSPKNIIIVNTLNIDKDMIVGRRSTYQQILSLEKKGSQVTERDLNFPVDVIINAAVCLAWYNSKSIGKKAALDGAISCLPLFVENLAASILTSLSFSFSGCIMVFEGESSYIAGVMESSDELYAAAASLGIDLQLFYSYSSEMTDEIILSCIKVATKSSRDLSPKMSDSETLAESFLTTFPSINPLSAHAILSTGGNLVNFLEWSPECRIRAVQKLHVPDESIALLSALSRFGEKESSLSGMTECSSSVSSVTDSENMHYKSNSESKKLKYRIGISNKKNSGKLQDAIGEVINIDDTNNFRDEFDADCPVTWSKQGHGMDRDTTPRMFYHHNLSPSNAGNHPTFPTAAEIETEGKRWFSEQAYGKRSGEGITQQREIVKKQMPGVLQKELLEECVLQNNDMCFEGPSIPCRSTPLSNAINSTQMQQGSPWTIEFLNRMREKSKQKRQSNPSAIFSLSYGSGWNEQKTTERKSPSILKNYKFRGGKTTKNGIELKKQNRFVKPSNTLKAEKPPIPIAPSWSPVDKIARRKLSFSTNGIGGQSKLVWER